MLKIALALGSVEDVPTFFSKDFKSFFPIHVQEISPKVEFNVKGLDL